jgi:hypothetical protein
MSRLRQHNADNRRHTERVSAQVLAGFEFKRAAQRAGVALVGSDFRQLDALTCNRASSCKLQGIEFRGGEGDQLTDNAVKENRGSQFLGCENGRTNAGLRSKSRPTSRPAAAFAKSS